MPRCSTGTVCIFFIFKDSFSEAALPNCRRSQRYLTTLQLIGLRRGLARNKVEQMQTIVIGHKNPDMDSICSAIAYAELKRKLGVPDVIAARAGNTNERIDLVLQKFGVRAPEFVSDVSATVADVMETKVISVAHDSSIYQAMNSIEKKRIRGLPVVDADNRCLGLLSAGRSASTFSRIVRKRRLRASSSDRSRTSSARLMASSLMAVPTTPGKKSL